MGLSLYCQKKKYYFSAFNTPFNKSCKNLDLLNSKYSVQRVLEQANIPVARGAFLTKDEFNRGNYEKRLSHLHYPLVIKPNLASHGTGVICNIKTPQLLQFQLEQHFIKYNNVLIEEFHDGLDAFRILVFNKKIIGVVRREPAFVIGDGINNLIQLISSKNVIRKKNALALGPILIDDEAKIRFAELGINEQFVPKEGEKIVLGYTCNASRGGDVETIAPNICSENYQLIKKIHKVLDLQLMGVDFQCLDLNQPLKDGNGIVVEINPEPNIRIHELPMYGKPQMVSRILMRSFIYRHPITYFYSLLLYGLKFMWVRIILLLGAIILLSYFLS